jgi:hypothetical protein
MHRSARPWAAAFAAALAIAPLGAVQASHAPAHSAVSLRYHFTVGERYAYNIHLDMHVSTSGTGAGASSPVEARLSGVQTYHILRVDAKGGAYAELSESHMSMTMTANGQTTTTAVPAQAPLKVYLGADGSQRGGDSNGLGVFGTPALGGLPAGPVAPGAKWSSTAHAALPSTLGASFAPMQVTAQNVFVRYVAVGGERAAVIDSTGALQYVTDTTVSGVPVHMHLSGSLNGESDFGTLSRRQLSATLHMDMHMFMSARAAGTAGQGVREHMVIALSMTPATS